eukprot:4101252-Amphidinium_carterae.1
MSACWSRCAVCVAGLFVQHCLELRIGATAVSRICHYSQLLLHPGVLAATQHRLREVGGIPVGVNAVNTGCGGEVEACLLKHDQ